MCDGTYKQWGVAVIMDPEPEESLEEILDDASQPTYREEDPLFKQVKLHCLLDKGVGWTPDFAREWVQEEVVASINNSVLHLIQMRSHRTAFSPAHNERTIGVGCATRIPCVPTS